MKIAIVGSGISGLTCAYLLAGIHDVTLFEKDDRLGGHTSTVMVQHEGRSISVDLGFIVFNERNYPNFCKLLDRLGVASQSTTMSFSVRDESDGFEFGGQSIAGIIGAATNLARLRWWSVVWGIARLAKGGKAALNELTDHDTIASLCASGRFSRRFLESYLLPMAAAIWSAPRRDLEQFPAKFFLRFFDNHGMLDLRSRPEWKFIPGGSQTYIDAMLRAIDIRILRGSAVQSVRRHPDRVVVRCAEFEEAFDEIIFATHPNEALAALADATTTERELLSAMPFQPNEVMLHTDSAALPKRRRCWAAWNYRVMKEQDRPAVVTYNMTALQRLGTRAPVCVTLNAHNLLDPSKVIERRVFSHPLYTLEGERARSRWPDISGVNRTHFCGAYWLNGFHEDGVNSALRVYERLGGRGGWL